MYNHNTTVTVTMNPSSALLEALLFPHSVLPTQDGPRNARPREVAEGERR